MFLKSLGALSAVAFSDVWMGQTVLADSTNAPPDLFDPGNLDLMFWLQPRTVNWIRPQSGERLSVTYWQDGHLNPFAYEEICHLLRDVQANQLFSIDTKLIDTLWAAQAFMQRFGFFQPLEITSGFRSAHTNEHLIERGLPAARNSLHLRGQAADFRIPGLHPEVLGQLMQAFRVGGVGFYYRVGAKGGWIHADTGPEREWRG